MIKKYILASLNIYLLIITSLIYIIGLITINIYPTSINYIVTISLAIATTITLICYLNKKKSIYNLGVILTFIFNTITIYNIIELNTNYEYLNNIVTNKYEYKKYDVYVQKKNTKYNEIEKLNNKKIYGNIRIFFLHKQNQADPAFSILPPAGFRSQVRF